MDSILIEDRHDGLHLTTEQGHTLTTPLNREEAHTWLSHEGYKRVGKQEGSDIGGVYVRA